MNGGFLPIPVPGLFPNGLPAIATAAATLRARRAAAPRQAATLALTKH